MATQTLTPVLPSKAGTTRIDNGSSDLQSMVVGSGNGSVVDIRQLAALVFVNEAGSAASFTIAAGTNTGLAARSMTISDIAYAVPDGQALIIPVSQVMATGGNITVECTVLGKILGIRRISKD